MQKNPDKQKKNPREMYPTLNFTLQAHFFRETGSEALFSVFVLWKNPENLQTLCIYAMHI